MMISCKLRASALCEPHFASNDRFTPHLGRSVSTPWARYLNKLLRMSVGATQDLLHFIVYDLMVKHENEVKAFHRM